MRDCFVCAFASSCDELIIPRSIATGPIDKSRDEKKRDEKRAEEIVSANIRMKSLFSSTPNFLVPVYIREFIKRQRILGGNSCATAVLFNFVRYLIIDVNIRIIGTHEKNGKLCIRVRF